MSCQINPNTTIVRDLQWWQLLGTLSLNKTCGDAYIRADIGGSLAPWLFTALQILVHLPVIVLRVICWQEVQTLSIILAIFNVAIISQAYAATSLAADHVLVWSPVSLVIDAGAMMQLVVLVKNDRPHWWRELLESFRPAKDNGVEVGTEMQVPQDSSMTPPPAAHLRTTTDIADAPQSTDASQPSNPSQPTNPAGSISPAQSHNPPIQPPNPAQSTNPAPPPNSSQESIADTSLNDTPQGTKSTVKSNFKSISKPEGRAAQPKFVASVIITSFLLLIAIFGIQITGLAAAFNGQKASDIKSSWCSPMFALFGVSELDLNCEFRAITGNPHKGIGCIELPGERQQTWLLVTKVFLPLSLAIQGVDFCVLCLTPPDKVWWKINLERPLLTMVCGLGLLVLTLTVGAVDAYRLPEGVTRKIWLVVDVGDPFLCTGFLTPAGLRGQFLAWLDGLLQSWNGVYFGD